MTAHAYNQPIVPEYDYTVNCGYLALCNCKVLTTADHTRNTATGINLDYARGMINGRTTLHITGIELLNIKNFDQLQKDLETLKIPASLQHVIYGLFVASPPAPKTAS